MSRGRDRTPEADDQVVRLEVPARPGYVVLARLALSAVCRLTPLGDDDVADLKLAITEAASAFVGDGDSPAGPLQPVPEPSDEETLRFAFRLGETELSIEIECDSDVDLSEAELELSRAILSATVDRCESKPGSILLIKQLVGAAGPGGAG